LYCSQRTWIELVRGEFSRKGGRCPSRQREERDSDLLSDGQGGEDYDAVRLEEPEAVGGTLTSLA